MRCPGGARFSVQFRGTEHAQYAGTAVVVFPDVSTSSEQATSFLILWRRRKGLLSAFGLLSSGKMPGKIYFDIDNMDTEEVLEVNSSEQNQQKKSKKEKKSKDEKKSKKQDPDEECEPPKPKKKKRDPEAINGDVGSSQKLQEPTNSKVVCDPISNGTSKMKLISHSSEESGPEGDSDAEVKEETPEQKEGAFSNFRISQETVNLLKERGVTYLFDIQAKTFNYVYDGSDVIAQARTGTGKTFSFAIPLIEKLQSDALERKRGRAPKVLVLTPTRELAIQVAKDFKDITRKLAIACFYGGTPYNPQIDAIRSGIDILVGTPGRIKDHLQNNKLDLAKLKHVVLDEVDQMLDMGFAEQVEEILLSAYKKGSDDNPQTLLFSATCPNWVYDVAKTYMRPQFEQVDLIGKKTKKTATTVEHLAIECHWSQRAAVIGDVIQVYSGSHGRTIIFCETKKEANELAINSSIKQDTQSLHGDIPQKQREITLKGFRNGSFEVLVATNVAARGLDIPEVDLVIQCSPPKDVESYIHRSGRTGRAGRTGVCICFYQRKEEDQLRFVETRAGITFKRVGVPTANDIIRASSKDAVRFLDAVPPSAVGYFRAAAEKLIEERGAVEALAAALAHISGAKSIEQRSLLSSDVGFVTMTMMCSVEMHNIGYAWRGLREQLGEDVDSKIHRMKFLKGKTGVCFDVPAASVKTIQESWKDSRRWQLSVATELPELEEVKRSGDRPSSGFGKRSFYGGGKRNDRFNNNRGQQKRSFGRAFAY
ncbi:nucleolar RNA helicase 2-like [Polypterus senegalus]|uniref:nucleolar RNA helicase 2-like n=1 Tax=Polypterus senegalus TaxID=55291 RepID=UPI001965A4E7|nr:nucleolar RNA helicase 2-like [Polypterus senegalus]